MTSSKFTLWWLPTYFLLSSIPTVAGAVDSTNWDIVVELPGRWSLEKEVDSYQYFQARGTDKTDKANVIVVKERRNAATSTLDSHMDAVMRRLLKDYSGGSSFSIKSESNSTVTVGSADKARRWTYELSIRGNRRHVSFIAFDQPSQTVDKKVTWLMISNYGRNTPLDEKTLATIVGGVRYKN